MSSQKIIDLGVWGLETIFGRLEPGRRIQPQTSNLLCLTYYIKSCIRMTMFGRSIITVKCHIATAP